MTRPTCRSTWRITVTEEVIRPVILQLFLRDAPIYAIVRVITNRQRSTDMTEQDILNAVQDIFRDNFDDDTLVITRETCADDIEDWDSLEQINLLTAIEKKFNIKFKLADVRNLKNVGDLLDLVARMVG